MIGFYPSPLPVRNKVTEYHLPQCARCGLLKTCRSPKMPIAGMGRRKILVIGEAPGRTEDEQNKPFAGKAGQLLQKFFADQGVVLFRDCWITNSLICRPEDNRTPTEKEIAYCRPNLVEAIRKLNPVTILLLGGSAIKSVIGWLWKNDVGAVGRWVGWRIPSQQLNCWVCPTWHPSYLARETNPTLDLLFAGHLKAAFSKVKRPWGTVPDWSRDVTILLDPMEAAKAILLMTEENKPTAFDYETQTLRPESPHAEIVCCSMSSGQWTIAYPWHGGAIGATKGFLLSPVPKISANCKFEDRYTRKHLGIEVNNFVFDTMQAAHVLDNRPGITGLKFQSFVTLGQPSYNDHIEPFLKGEGSNGKNRIRQADLNQILTYCGLDSLLEHKLAKIQAKKLGVSL